MLGKHGGVFYFIEILNQVAREVAEKTVFAQMAIKTALDAVQAGHYGHSSVCSQQWSCSLASNDRKALEFRGRGWPTALLQG
jgi:hypothetical protein